ncbi:MAG: HAMP domain-containing sensor histidine kinase [Actinomycetota bacterium]
MTLRTRLAVALAVMLVGAVAITGVVALNRMEAALIDEVDALVLFRLSGPADPPPSAGLVDGRGPSLTTENAPFGETGGRTVAEFVVRTDTGEVVSALLAGFDDAPVPAPDLSRLPEGTLDGPVTMTSVDGEIRYRVLTRLDERDATQTRVVAGSLASADETLDDLRRAVLVAGVIAAALGAMIGWLIIRRETRPLDELLDAADAFADGDLDRRAAVARPGSEIGRVGVGLNEAFDRVETSVRAEQAANGRLAAFVDDIAHELRTPATTIAGWAEMYQDGSLHAADVDRMVERIRSETTRLSSLVEDMVVLARHDTVRPNRLGDVDLAEIIRGAVDDANVLDATRSIAVLGPLEVPMRGDRARLEQVFVNILDNARVHTPPGTTVDIVMSVDPGPPGPQRIEVSIVDDGPGIPTDAAERVFDRSFRAATAGSRGRGLGLAIVKTIVEDHGGTIGFDPEVDHGTRVVVVLPRG